MLVDGLKLTEGSAVTNMTVATGTSFPTVPDEGELFVKLGDGFYFYESGAWHKVSTLANGKLDSAQLPSLAITDVYVVANQAAMLALSAEQGDVAVRTDISKTFILSNSVPSVLANWVELKSPAAAGGGGGGFDPLAKPDAVSYIYDAAGRVSVVTSTYSGIDLVETYTYNTDDTVHQLVSTFNGTTKTETYAYSADGMVSSISLS